MDILGASKHQEMSRQTRKGVSVPSHCGVALPPPIENSNTLCLQMVSL